MLVYYAFIALLTSLLSDATTALRMDTIVATRTLNSPANIKFLQLSQTKCPSVRYEKILQYLFYSKCSAWRVFKNTLQITVKNFLCAGATRMNRAVAEVYYVGS